MKISQRKEPVVLRGGDEDLTVLHISDVHLWFSTRILSRIALVIKDVQPDLIIMTGDYYDIPQGAHRFREFLVELGQEHLVIFVMGNHDLIYGSQVSDLLLGIANCTCVDRSIYTYRSKRGYFYNITSWNNRNALPTNTDVKNLVLMHNPEKITDHNLSHVDLIFAGHLHGGQFIFFTSKDGSYFPGNMVYRHCTGRKQINNTTLIVSRGLGDTFPFRFNCPREVVQVAIR